MTAPVPASANGRQVERTTLAWRRTNLAALTVSALAAKASGRPAVALLVFATAFGTCAVVGIEADRRGRARATAIDDWDAGRIDPRSSAAAPVAIAAATGLTLALAALGIVIALVS